MLALIVTQPEQSRTTVACGDSEFQLAGTKIDSLASLSPSECASVTARCHGVLIQTDFQLELESTKLTTRIFTTRDLVRIQLERTIRPRG